MHSLVISLTMAATLFYCTARPPADAIKPRIQYIFAETAISKSRQCGCSHGIYIQRSACAWVPGICLAIFCVKDSFSARQPQRKQRIHNKGRLCMTFSYSFDHH
eukprot:jgi/Botrbrau1/1877/Bobra.146_1s0063.1